MYGTTVPQPPNLLASPPIEEASLFGFDHRPSQSCRLCGRSQHPEVLTRLEVRYLEVAPEA